MLIKKAVVNATEAQIAELWEIERRLEQQVDQADYASALQANREFHAPIQSAVIDDQA
jgi:DNA-binding GntR family transcriptional regulator